MADSVYQFRALKVLDEFFGSSDPGEREANYDLALARLEADGFDPVGRPVAGVRDHLDHLGQHWLQGRQAGYWPNIPAETVAQCLQEGFLAAIRDAKKAGLPLVSIWVCSTEDPESADFRVEHVVGPTAVIVAIITPRPKR